jgi:hypothetical protein
MNIFTKHFGIFHRQDLVSAIKRTARWLASRYPLRDCFPMVFHECHLFSIYLKAP